LHGSTCERWHRKRAMYPAPAQAQAGHVTPQRMEGDRAE
jgi:hypothetical protein